MLKTVTMAMPTFAMPCFKLPAKLCKEIAGMMARYWWGETDRRNKIHWCSWAKMSKEEKNGGLGFRDLQCCNTALLEKQVWRMIRFPNLLVSRILKAKYYPKDSLLDCEVPEKPSWIWQSIVATRDIVKGGILRRVGTGKSINIWKDNWIPNNPNGRPTTMRLEKWEEQKVEELLTNFRWNRNAIFKKFNKVDTENILKIPISISGNADKHFWIHSRHEEYTVKSCYKVLMKKGRLDQAMMTRIHKSGRLCGG